MVTFFVWFSALAAIAATCVLLTIREKDREAQATECIATESAPEIIEVPGQTIPPETQPPPGGQPAPSLNSEVQGGKVKVGTVVFGAFAALSLLVSIVKGIVPIYLLEAAGWAGAAWYWQRRKSESDLAKGVIVCLAVVVAVGEITQITYHTLATTEQSIANLNGMSQPTNSATSAGSNDQSPSANGFNIPTQASTTPCPTGLPAGVQVVPIGDLTTLSGSDGSDSGGENHSFSFKVSNNTAVAQPNQQFDGYCITAIEVEVDFQGENGTVRQLTGKQDLGSHTSPYLSPGWYEEFSGIELRPVTRLAAELTDWKITKAWGFPLNPANAPKQPSSPGVSSITSAPTRSKAHNSGPTVPPPLDPARIAVTEQQAVALYKKESYADAAPLFQRACDGGNGEACGYLGLMYQGGLGVTRDKAYGAALYSKGCDAGNFDDCDNLGAIYELGDGVERDYSRSFYLYSNACSIGGDAKACTDLGELYSYGRGAAVDLNKAQQYFAEACRLGDKRGCSEFETTH